MAATGAGNGSGPVRKSGKHEEDSFAEYFAHKLVLHEDHPVKLFPTNGDVGDPSVDGHYFIIAPLDGYREILSDRLMMKQWTTFVGPRQQGKTSTTKSLVIEMSKVKNWVAGYCSASELFVAGSPNDAVSIMSRMFQQASLLPDEQDLFDWLAIFREAKKSILLVVDEFDFILKRPEPVRHAVMGLMKALRDMFASTLEVIIVGSASVLRVTGPSGISPFNANLRMVAKGFTEVQVGRLLEQAVAAKSLPEGTASLAADIMTWTSGHRGMVAHIAEALRKHSASNSITSAEQLKPKLRVLMTKLPGWVMEQSLGVTVVKALKELDEEGGKQMTRALHELVYKEKVSTATGGEAARLLAELGLITPANDSGWSKPISPMFHQLLLTLLAGRLKHDAGIVLTAELEVDIPATVISCITSWGQTAMAHAGVASHKLPVRVPVSRRHKHVPSEAVYHYSLYAALFGSDCPFSRSVLAEATCETGRVDLILKVNEIDYALELVAHERPAPCDRDSSILGHCRRLNTYGRGDPENRWVIDFEMAVDEDTDRAHVETLRRACTNLMVVFHSRDWKTCRVWTQPLGCDGATPKNVTLKS